MRFLDFCLYSMVSLAIALMLCGEGVESAHAMNDASISGAANTASFTIDSEWSDSWHQVDVFPDGASGGETFTLYTKTEASQDWTQVMQADGTPVTITVPDGGADFSFRFRGRYEHIRITPDDLAEGVTYDATYYGFKE